jgi:flagellar motility protein MotE (MotC chaperone)
LDDVREMIGNVGTDTGVAMLLAISEDDAARVLADCPPRLCGMLLQGIAVARPGTAATILRLLQSGKAGRAFAYLRPDTAASLVAVMAPVDALRVLDSTDERTAAGVITELPPPASTALLKSMSSRQRAAQVLTHVRPVTAAELLSSDAEFASAVLRHLSEPVRKQVSRHLQPDWEHRA